MQGIVSGAVLVVAFVAMAVLAILVAARLYWISRPGQSPGPRGEPPDA
jgi:hypothetical protein